MNHSFTHGDLFVRHAIADTGVQLVQRLPGLFRVRQVPSGSDGSLKALDQPLDFGVPILE